MKKNNSDSDKNIVAKVKEGDASAFRLLIEKYKDVSFSLACSILPNQHEAEDALQESFLKVYKNIGKFSNKSSFATWLYRLVVNTCFTLAKKQNRINFYDTCDTEKSNESETITGYEKFIISERKEIITAALKMIKPEESLLLRLYYLSELDIKEIKKVTGFKESKIKVTLYRGRKSLHAVLHKLLGNELKLIL